MSEWLTTGAMIDRLKVGEFAVGDVNDLGVEVKIFKDEVGHIKFHDTKHLLDMSAGIVDSVKWRILPNYVSFEEAMKAHVNGIGVRFHPSENQSIYIGSNSDMKLKDGWFSHYTLRDLVNGKWSIKEENNESIKTS